MTKINKILIANRGEIACRVMKTARKLGIKTVAVYSDADKKALHTRMADEAVHIGASPAAESYLVIDKIVDACKQTGADAVHPGYGFLSENPAFVRACDAAGIIFIGPKAESMEAMGLKDAAKKLMVEAGVPVTPGYHGEDQTPDLLKSKAGMIGYPVLIKAVAGGGGKGMRKVETEDEFISSLESCQREARSSFGDDRVLIEKYITSPRHIEVQVFGDTHGNVVHMFERDCSLQRRHQKVIEEAPAPGMTESVRAAMTKAAIQAAKAVDYVGAGTVEFIVDGSGKLRTDGFWFMEMNTRLQVEHPVSEMITGLDFVELQIRVAEGGELPKQTEIKLDGHAIEARLYAEDPANDFLPSVGPLAEYRVGGYRTFDAEVDSGPSRVDSGVEKGDEITVFYDPMIAKYICHENQRGMAIATMTLLLHNTEIDGIITNKRFLHRAINHRDFRDGKISTAFIPDNLITLTQVGMSEQNEYLALAAAACTFDLLGIQENSSPFGAKKKNHVNSPFEIKDNWRLNGTYPVKWDFVKNGDVETAVINSYSQNHVEVCIGADKPVLIPRHDPFDRYKYFSKEDIKVAYEPASPLKFDHWTTQVTDHGVYLSDSYHDLFVQKFMIEGTSASGLSSNALTSPMPGKIIAVNAAPGDTVKAGDPLIIMEAMKMEMTLEAPRDGVVGAVNVAADALVSDGDVLLEMAEEEK